MQMTCAIILLAAFATIGGLGGCATTEATTADDGGAQREDCTLKVTACVNRCYKAGFGPACRLCGQRAGRSCDEGGDYSFYACTE